MTVPILRRARPNGCLVAWSDNARQGPDHAQDLYSNRPLRRATSLERNGTLAQEPVNADQELTTVPRRSSEPTHLASEQIRERDRRGVFPAGRGRH